MACQSLNRYSCTYVVGEYCGRLFWTRWNRAKLLVELMSKGKERPVGPSSGARREVTRLSTALRALGKWPKPEQLLDVLQRHPAAESQPCLRPGCTELIAWGGRGRPKSFCTSECRIAYDTRRAELLAQIELLEGVAYRVPSETTRVVLSDLARRRWELLRYPVLDAPRS